MGMGWSVSGRRVEIKAGFPAGKLAIDGTPVAKLKLNGEAPVDIDGRTYTFRRKPGILTPIVELIAPGGNPVPLSNKHTPRKPASAGSKCAVHLDMPAVIVCARCGKLACAQCCETDGTHCVACIQPMVESHKKHQADLVLLAPALIFIVTGGALGGLLGGGAGALAVSLAPRFESKLLKWGVALALYGLAGVLYVVIVAPALRATGTKH